MLLSTVAAGNSLFQYVGRWLVTAATILATAASASEVCRLPSFNGMTQRTQLIKSIVGANTADLSKIKLYVTIEDGETYIQSNFLSVNAESKTLAEYPTKLKSADIKDLDAALLNTIFWAEKLPDNASQVVAEALKNAEIFVDRATIDQNGRPLLDLTGATKLRLTHGDSSVVKTGELTTLELRKPPPALIERISGCCLFGRPPGRAQAIVERMRAKKISKDDVALLPLVIDSATDAVIAGDSTLKAALDKAAASKAEGWDARVGSSFAAAQGKSLLVLGHIEGEKVVVRDPSGKSLYETTPASLRDMAAKYSVNLILFGCDTAKYINQNSMGLGVVGKYNTATAAERLGEALRKANNHGELIDALASNDLKLVAYDERGGNGEVGASAFAKVRGESILSRVFRVLFLSRA